MKQLESLLRREDLAATENVFADDLLAVVTVFTALHFGHRAAENTRNRNSRTSRPLSKKKVNKRKDLKKIPATNIKKIEFTQPTRKT